MERWAWDDFNEPTNRHRRSLAAIFGAPLLGGGARVGGVRLHRQPTQRLCAGVDQRRPYFARLVGAG